jgi:hypothetical protein
LIPSPIVLVVVLVLVVFGTIKTEDENDEGRRR